MTPLISFVRVLGIELELASDRWTEKAEAQPDEAPGSHESHCLVISIVLREIAVALRTAAKKTFLA